MNRAKTLASYVTPVRSGQSSRFRVGVRRQRRRAVAVLSVVTFLVAWQVAAGTGWANTVFTSSPLLVWRSLVDYLSWGGSGWHDLAVSGREFAYGLLLAIAIGVPAGILMGWYRMFDAALNPYVDFFMSSPRIALAPLFVIWFGLGTVSKVWVVVIMAIIPIIIGARAGVKTVDPSTIAMARSYGASDRRLMRTVVLPGTLPAISAGIRIGIAQSLHGVVIAEFVASTAGLGHTVVTAAANFDPDRLFVAVVVIGVIGMIASAVLGRVERYFDRWRLAE